jgi:PEP-CTERM motif
MRRLLLGLAAWLLILNAGPSNVRAGQINLPIDLGTLEVAGNFAIVNNLKFSNFQYTVTPTGTPPAASGVTVASFTSLPGEPGITFNAPFFAAANTVVDYAISFQVTTTDGSLINDAFLSLGGFSNFGGNGRVSIGETILDTSGHVLSKVPFDVFTPGKTSDLTLLSPSATTIIVQKDIAVFGGSEGTVFSFANQGFSTAVPEPGSMALLGIGLSGLLTVRRLRRRGRPSSN